MPPHTDILHPSVASSTCLLNDLHGEPHNQCLINYDTPEFVAKLRKGLQDCITERDVMFQSYLKILELQRGFAFSVHVLIVLC